MSIESTYAEALHGAASDQNVVDQVAAQLAEFADAVEQSDELSGVLGNPNIDAATKKSVVTQLTEQAHPLVNNLLQVLVDRGRLGQVGAVSAAYQAKVAVAQGKIEITATTAVPLDDEMREKIIERVRVQTGRTAELTELVDEDLIGGIVLEVGEIRVDGSIRHRLDTLHRNLSSAPMSA